MINELNWTHCQYESSNYSTKISIGGEMDRNNNYLETYFVNRFHGEQLLFQKNSLRYKKHVSTSTQHMVIGLSGTWRTMKVIQAAQAAKHISRDKYLTI